MFFLRAEVSSGVGVLCSITPPYFFVGFVLGRVSEGGFCNYYTHTYRTFTGSPFLTL